MDIWKKIKDPEIPEGYMVSNTGEVKNEITGHIVDSTIVSGKKYAVVDAAYGRKKIYINTEDLKYRYFDREYQIFEDVKNLTKDWKLLSRILKCEKEENTITIKGNRMSKFQIVVKPTDVGAVIIYNSADVYEVKDDIPICGILSIIYEKYKANFLYDTYEDIMFSIGSYLDKMNVKTIMKVETVNDQLVIVISSDALDRVFINASTLTKCQIGIINNKGIFTDVSNWREDDLEKVKEYVMMTMSNNDGYELTMPLSLQGERWIPINWYPDIPKNKYYISNCGRVYNGHTGNILSIETRTDIHYHGFHMNNADYGKRGISIRGFSLPENMARAFLHKTKVPFKIFKIEFLDGDRNNIKLENMRLVLKMTGQGTKIPAIVQEDVEKLYGILSDNSLPTKYLSDEIEKVTGVKIDYKTLHRLRERHFGYTSRRSK